MSRAHSLNLRMLGGLLLLGSSAIAWADSDASPRPSDPRPAVTSRPPGAEAAKPAPVTTDTAEKPASPAPGNTTAAAGTASASAAAAAAVRVEKAGSSKLFRITEGMLVEGQRQKPNAFYVLQRASAAYDWESLDENFLQRIIKATEKPPF